MTLWNQEVIAQKEVIKVGKEALRLAEQKLKQLADAQAVEESPFKVGDIVTDGKKKGRVSAVLAHYPGSYNTINYRIFYRTILKDGTDGTADHDIYQPERWKKVT